MSDLVERLRKEVENAKAFRLGVALSGEDGVSLLSYIEELEGKLTACEKALAHPIIQKVALAGGLIKPPPEAA